MGARKRKATERFGETPHDEIGFWSEIKLEILEKYWPAYTRIIQKQSYDFRTIYADAFAGSGEHLSRTTGEFVKGSPARALDVMPAFHEYHFIDLDEAKVKSLERLAADRDNVKVHHGDCNKVMLETVLPRARYEDYHRAVCLLDPYRLQLDWSVIQKAGSMKSIEIFLNFPIMDINRAVLHDGATQSKQHRMTRFWGDETWRATAYRDTPTLFGDLVHEKVSNWELVQAFRERLNKIAGFKYVPEPLAMRNTQRASVYYLYFAGPNEKGAKIVNDIFNGYREKGYGRR